MTAEVTPIVPLEQDAPSRTEATSAILELIASNDANQIEPNPASSMLDAYLEQRDACKDIPKIDGQRLTDIQQSSSQWFKESGLLDEPIDYTTYDKAVVLRKIGGLVDYLRANHPDVTEQELSTTLSFVDCAFGMYYDAPKVDKAEQQQFDGSFAFVVPPRVSRHNTEYGEEVEPAIPALRYVPNEIRSQMLVGLPPFVIDVYEPARFGKRGYLVFAPVFGDGLEDMGGFPFLSSAIEHVNNAVDFASDRLGVNIAGLGAVLPAVTKFGQKIRNEDVITTTGHGGTTHLIKKTVVAAIEQGYLDGKVNPSIGVLGLGSIGASIAEIMSEEFPDQTVTIFDADTAKGEKVFGKIAEKNANVRTAVDEGQLIEESDIIISAITGHISLASVAPEVDLTDKIVIDDSQPGSFDPEEVTKHGGNLAWVIGHDTLGVVVRQGYDYGTLADSKRDVFGCEAEAGTLARMGLELSQGGLSIEDCRARVAELALRGPVNVASARALGLLLDKSGVEVAPFQNFGTTIE